MVSRDGPRQRAAAHLSGWSSYRTYVGLAKAPAWLETQTVLGLGGGCAGDGQRRAYREYVESAVREGLAESPWEHLQAQIVLGRTAFARRLREGLGGDAREQPELRQLQIRPTLREVISRVERLKGENWAAFRDRYGDWGRDLVLYLGRRDCGLKLRELGEAAGGIDYVSVATAVKRFERKLERDASLVEGLREARKMTQTQNA